MSQALAKQVIVAGPMVNHTWGMVLSNQYDGPQESKHLAANNMDMTRKMIAPPFWGLNGRANP